MHDIFLMSSLELVRNFFNGSIIVIIPKSKLSRIGEEYFHNLNIKLIDYKTPKRKIFFPNFISILLHYISSSLFIILGPEKRIFRILDDSLQDVVSFLALEAYPYGGNKFVNRILKKYSFVSKSIVFHDALGYKNTINKHLSHNKLKSFIIYSLMLFTYRQESSLFNRALVLGPALVNVAKKIHHEVIFFPASIPSKKLSRLRLQFLKSVSVKKLHFVIPGIVDSERRNYKAVIEIFSNLDSSKYLLTFLGKTKDYDLVNSALSNNINLKYYEDVLDGDDFEKVMIQASFIIYCPSDKNLYGTSIVSGVPYDSLRYGIPLINLSNEKFPGLFDLGINDLECYLKALFDKDNFIDLYMKTAFEVLHESLLYDISFYEDTINKVLYGN